MSGDPLDLDAIEARQRRLSGQPLSEYRWMSDAIGLLVEADVPALVAEVRQLSTELGETR